LEFNLPRTRSTPFVVTDSHFALLAPLSGGEHTLELGGALCDADGNVQFETAAVYHLWVAD